MRKSLINYCTMQNKDCSLVEGRLLQWLPPVLGLDDYLAVCPGCNKPRYLVYMKLVKRCDDCWNPFALPWEEMCSNCFYLNCKEGARYSGLQASRAPALLTNLRRIGAWNREGVAALVRESGYTTWAELLTQSVEVHA